jgi:hypothetical protein
MALKGEKIITNSHVEKACSNSEPLTQSGFQKNSSGFFWK